jgi:Cdc6-like AAA superfamily ATPase
MRNVFESGGAPGWDGVGGTYDKLLERPALVGELQALFMPEKSEHLYHVIGNEGTGKTTAIRGALLSLASPKAVVYCNVGSAKTFVVDLAKAVGYRPSFSVRDRVGWWILREEPPTLTWVKLKSKLDEVAKVTSKPLVIVLDSADRLFEEDPAFFSELQRDAKTAADSGGPIYVFVLTKGRALVC